MVPAVFVFGDSLVDVGNNNYLKLSLAKADFPHNDVNFPTKKPTGRFTNDKNVADFIGTYVTIILKDRNRFPPTHCICTPFDNLLSLCQWAWIEPGGARAVTTQRGGDGRVGPKERGCNIQEII
jgi:hypothetical protein